MAKRIKRTSGLNFGKEEKGSDESCETILSLAEEAHPQDSRCDPNFKALSY